MSQFFYRFVVILLVGAAAKPGVAGDQAAIDQSRLDAARQRARLHWATAGYDALPSTFDTASVRKSKDVSIVGSIADTLLDSNPTRSDAVLDYINRAVIPFVMAHRAQYECYLAEDYYNIDAANIPTEQLASFGESPLSLYFDLAYLLLNTEAARLDAAVVLPETGDWQRTISSARKNGFTKPSNKIHFDCAA